MSQETVAAQDMLTRFAAWQGREPESVAADTTYGNGEFLQWLMDRNITPYMRTRDSIHRKRSPYFGPDRFAYEPEHDRYICPAGQPLKIGQKGKDLGTLCIIPLQNAPDKKAPPVRSRSRRATCAR